MKFNFKYKEKKFSIDVKRCGNIFSKTLGLMFRQKSKPLLFIYKKPTRQGIHSFFCEPFVAIWFDKEKVIDVKLIEPFRFLIRPPKKFDKILEIHSCDKNYIHLTNNL